METDDRSPSVQATKPRGILKRPSVGAHEAGPRPTGLAWDEENLTINELGKNSTMKITEPKTPYVKYDAETDTVMDLDKIPGFELGAPDVSYSPSSSSTGLGSGPNSRRGSEASEKMVKVDLPEGASDDDSDEDEENQDPETVEHRKEFASKRGGHYRNEAEAMKRAAAMLAEEDEASNESGAEAPPVPPLPKANGV